MVRETSLNVSIVDVNYVFTNESLGNVLMEKQLQRQLVILMECNQRI